MSPRSILFILVHIISACTATFSTLPSTTAASALSVHSFKRGLTTPPPSFPHTFELRKRTPAPGRTCGWSQRKDSSWPSWTVLSPYFCAGTILPDGSAYAYSSDAEVGSQYLVYTTAVGNWDSKKSCPTTASTMCWCVSAILRRRLLLAR